MSASKLAEKAIKPLLAAALDVSLCPPRARRGSAAVVLSRAFERGILEQAQLQAQ